MIKLKSPSDFKLTRFDQTSPDYINGRLNTKIKNSTPTFWVVVIVILLLVLAIFIISKY